jgi:uncharacterized membrane protein YfcA
VFLIAGTIKGTVGIGLPTAALGMLVQFSTPHEAMALIVFPIMILNAWQVWREGEAAATFRAYWKFAAALMIALYLATYVTASVSSEALMLALGVVIVIFSVTALFLTPPPLPERWNDRAQVIAGLLAGVMGGLTAIWSPPMVIYLLARRVEKAEFVRATGLLILLGGLPLCVGLWRAGLVTGANAPVSIAMVVPAMAGFTLGEVLRRRLDTARFRIAVLVLFLLMGLNLVRRAMF